VSVPFLHSFGERLCMGGLPGSAPILSFKESADSFSLSPWPPWSQALRPRSPRETRGVIENGGRRCV
jgi:hypothetical protein